MPVDSKADRFLKEEKRIEARSDNFKKELGLTDLALTQILFIVGLPWVGVAAKQGPSHIVLWLVALLLFYIPSAVVVIYLSRVMPLEGGLYQWAKMGFNELIGFLVGWNLWLFGILNTSEIGLQATEYLVYIFGPRSNWLLESRWAISLVNVIIIGGLVWITSAGFHMGKWVHKAGGVMMLLTFGTIMILPWLNLAHGSLRSYHPFRTEMPIMSVMSFNLLAKMGFGAFGGFEYVAIHAGECRDPARVIKGSVMIAAPIIALMFILGTSSVLALIPIDQIDLIAPIPQVLSAGFNHFGAAMAVAPAAIVALLWIRVAQSSVQFAGNTRLPMVAGWDRLLPEWFSRLHPKYKTPLHSILFIGAVTLAFSLAGLIGVGKQEAFQLLWNASGLFYALTYVVMFAIPIFGLHSLAPGPSPRLKLAALSGLLMTLLYVALSIVPIIHVENRFSFAAKISGVILITNAIGWTIFRVARQSRSRI